MRMLGGYFRFDRANAPLLVKLLPSIVHIRREEPEATRLRRIVELIGEEADAHRPGRALILERLVEVLLVEALRFRSASAAREEQGLLAGLSDSALARTLREIHVDVARRWTVEQFARTAGMSRAVFAERFARKVGMPPMHYLLEWRVALAKEMLRGERPSLAEVAEKIGYQSASAFSTGIHALDWPLAQRICALYGLSTRIIVRRDNEPCRWRSRRSGRTLASRRLTIKGGFAGSASLRSNAPGRRGEMGWRRFKA